MPESTPDPTSPSSASTTRPENSRPAGTAASAGERTEHAQDRFARWETAQGRDTAAGKRRLFVIAGIVVLGLIIWLFWTH